jgi:hypothetical protein
MSIVSKAEPASYSVRLQYDVQIYSIALVTARLVEIDRVRIDIDYWIVGVRLIYRIRWFCGAEDGNIRMQCCCCAESAFQLV